MRFDPVGVVPFSPRFVFYKYVNPLGLTKRLDARLHSDLGKVAYL